jgi:hypothetical protein
VRQEIREAREIIDGNLDNLIEATDNLEVALRPRKATHG